MTDTEDARNAAVLLAGRAAQVARVSGREWWREVLRWMSRGRLGRRRGWPVVPRLDAPWQDRWLECHWGRRGSDSGQW
ncbi:hypothetical protein GCM10029978_066130 [Actinoallomurus acanthiterrae]